MNTRFTHCYVLYFEIQEEEKFFEQRVSKIKIKE